MEQEYIWFGIAVVALIGSLFIKSKKSISSGRGDGEVNPTGPRPTKKDI